MRKLDFLIIGTQKAGTTSLYEYITQHPQLYLPKVKEIQYFVDERFYNKGESYLNSFTQDRKNETIGGMAYVHMLPSKEAPLRVKAYNPDMKMLVMLRDPVKRAYSAYNFALKNGWENKGVSFIKSLELEPQRLAGNYTEQYELAYFFNGLYHQHLLNWLDHFPKQQILVMSDTDLRNHSEVTLAKVFDFLGVDNQQIETNIEHNKAGGVKIPRLQRALMNKESKWKQRAGGLLPQKAKVAIRSTLMKPIKTWNMMEEASRPITKEELALVGPYFTEDLEGLVRDFKINFK
jgi:hypothetical protein